MKETKNAILHDEFASTKSTQIIENSLDVISLIIIWITFTSVAPFVFFYIVPDHPYKLLTFAGLLACCILLTSKSKIRISSKEVFLVLLTQVVFFGSIFSFLHNSFTIAENSDGSVTLAIQFISILVLNTYVFNFYSSTKLAKSYIYVIILMGFLGWIIFVLGLIGAPILDIATIHVSFFDKRPSYNFWLTHTNAIYVVGNSLIVRVAGFFDEPGTFAYYITFALILNKTYGFGRKLEILLFLAGFPTLSLAYFISTLLYLILFYLNLKNIRYFAILTLTLILLTNYIHANRDASDVNAQIYDKTLGRFSLTQSDGKIIEGDNRSQLFNNGFEAFQDAPIIGHGVHYQKNPKSKYRNIYFGANLMAPFATYGIVGVAFLWLHFYFWSYLIFIYFPKSKVKKIFIFSWLIVAINLLQRPDLIGLLNYFLVLLLIDSTLRSKKMLEKKINET